MCQARWIFRLPEDVKSHELRNVRCTTVEGRKVVVVVSRLDGEIAPVNLPASRLNHGKDGALTFFRTYRNYLTCLVHSQQQHRPACPAFQRTPSSSHCSGQLLLLFPKCPLKFTKEFSRSINPQASVLHKLFATFNNISVLRRCLDHGCNASITAGKPNHTTKSRSGNGEGSERMKSRWVTAGPSTQWLRVC